MNRHRRLGRLQLTGLLLCNLTFVLTVVVAGLTSWLLLT